MQAFRVAEPTNPENPHIHLMVYRVKLEFQWGSVTWPVGAIRFWTTDDLGEIQKKIAEKLYSETEAKDFFHKHFERVELRYEIV